MAASPSEEKLRVGYSRDLHWDKYSIYLLIVSRRKYTEERKSANDKTFYSCRGYKRLRNASRAFSDWGTGHYAADKNSSRRIHMNVHWKG